MDVSTGSAGKRKTSSDVPVLVKYFCHYFFVTDVILYIYTYIYICFIALNQSKIYTLLFFIKPKVSA